MPSKKKRINLTVPDDLYKRIQEYKRQYCLECDATVCLQLITQCLKLIYKL